MANKIDKKDQIQLKNVGFDTNGTQQRSGSFLTADQQVKVSDMLDDGVEILSMKNAFEKYDWAEALHFNLVKKDKDQYTEALSNTDPVGSFIRAKEGARIIHPVQSCFYLKTEKTTQKVHNIIIVEPNSELHIITGCTTADYVSHGQHLGVTEFYIKENAKLTYTMIHAWAPHVEVFPRSAAYIEKNGTFISNYVALTKAKHVQANPQVYVEEGGTARLHSIVYSSGDSLYDLGGSIYLNGENAKGEIISRVVSNGGNIISRGYLESNAIKTKGHMECSGLLLNDQGYIHAVPELKAAVPNTDLSHEAAVGKINDQEILYLMTRGLDEETATSLIVRGFLDVRLQGLPESLQTNIDSMIEKTSIQGI